MHGYMSHIVPLVCMFTMQSGFSNAALLGKEAERERRRTRKMRGDKEGEIGRETKEMGEVRKI